MFKTGYKQTIEHRKRISESHKGLTHTQAARIKISKAGKGRIPWNKGTKGVMKAWNKGIPMDPLVKARMITSLKGRRLSPKTEFKKGSMGHWKGGKRVCGKYIVIYQPFHPNQSNKCVPEHRLIMEKHIGCYLLKTERVHHINGKHKDNRLENLMLFANESAHQKYHHYLKSSLARARTKITARLLIE